MPYSCEQDSRQNPEGIKFPYGKPDGILLCTTRDGHKHKGMLRQIRNGDFNKIPVQAANPNSIPENVYNGLFSNDAGMIAAIKVLQLGKKHPQVTQVFFGNTRNIQMIANDILLQVGCGNNNEWKTFNKPDATCSDKQIK